MLSIVTMLLALAASPSFLYLESDTVLYQASANGYEPLCTLPATYFVIPVSADKEGYTAVSWLDINGYIKTEQAAAVDYEPLTPHLSRTLDAANDLNPVNIRSSPFSADNVIGAIPHGKTAVIYGETEGDALIPQVGSLWYYVRYSDGSLTYTGYVYSAQVSAQPITPNTMEKVTPPVTDPIQPETEMPSLAHAALIIALCIPAVIIVLIIFRPSKTPRTPRSL